MAKNPKDSIFTVDADITGTVEVPTITGLLRRKKLKNSPTQTMTQSTPSVDPRGRPSVAPKSAPPKKLAVLDFAHIAKLNPGLASGLTFLARNGAEAGLYFALILDSGTRRPLLNAAAYFGAADMARTWTGRCWNPIQTPTLWKKFVIEGHFELGPTSGNWGQEERLLRTAFGIRAWETATIIRVGSAERCLGGLLLISRASLRHVLPQALLSIAADSAFDQAS